MFADHLDRSQSHGFEQEKRRKDYLPAFRLLEFCSHGWGLHQSMKTGGCKFRRSETVTVLLEDTVEKR
jgi:hypothetical protein